LAVRHKEILYSLFFFLLAGVCEIGGGYLVWLWLREDSGWLYGAFGGLVLFLYGIIPTYQKAHFHRTYAAYGGIFVIMAMFWGYFFDGVIPDTYDIIGAIIASMGVIIIFYYPRRKGEKIGINQSNGL